MATDRVRHDCCVYEVTSLQGSVFEKQLNIVKLSMKRRSVSATVDGSGQSASWQKCVYEVSLA